MISSLKKEITEKVPLEFLYHGRSFKGVAEPVMGSCEEEICFELNVSLNGEQLGTIYCGYNGNWSMKGIADQEFVNAIGQEIFLWYE